MFKTLHQIMQKYAKGKASESQRFFVETYFDQLQENGLSAKDVAQDKDLKKQILRGVHSQVKSQATKRRYFSYKVAASIAILVALGLFSTSKAGFFNQSASMQVVTTVKGEHTYFYLSDSTLVRLAPESSLSFEKSFDKHATRVVSLKGEAYFEVKKTATNNGFSVKSSSLLTQVLGTKFLVNDTPGEPLTVNVDQGKVHVISLESQASITLEKNQGATYNPKQADFTTRELSNDKNGYALTNRVEFNALSLEQVVLVLNRRFKQEITLQTKNMPKYTISGDFTTDNIQDILNSLHFIYGINYEKTDNGNFIVFDDSIK